MNKIYEDTQRSITIAKSYRWIVNRLGATNEFIVDLHPLQTKEELQFKFIALRLLSEWKLVVAREISDEFLLFGSLTKKGLKIKELIQCRTNT